MGCKKQGNCSHTCVEDACTVCWHQSGVMWSFAVTKERRTSWLGVGTLEMAGQKRMYKFILPAEEFKGWLEILSKTSKLHFSSLSLFVFIVGCRRQLLSVVIVCPLCSLLLLFVVIIVHHLCHLLLSS